MREKQHQQNTPCANHAHALLRLAVEDWIDKASQQGASANQLSSKKRRTGANERR